MSERFDAVILGAGPGGEHLAFRLHAQGLKTALVERELVGGECGYWACIPSKTLLRAPEIEAEAQRAAGVGRPELRWPEISRYRDYMIRDLDDASGIEAYEDTSVTVIKGAGRITGPGRVEVDGRALETERIVVATGTEPVIPPLEGLDRIDYWTNREATTFKEIPRSAVVLGGGPVGLELAQMLRRYGAEVTLVESHDRLVAREEPGACEKVAELLAEDGVEVRLGARAKSVAGADGDIALTLEDGSEARGERLIVAVGRRPRVEGVGLDAVGIEPGEKGIEVDERCRAGDGVWAIGDVTGIMPFTHVAKYQARVVAADMAGHDVKADYRAIPRVVFLDPELAAVGLTSEQAGEMGIDVTTGTADLGQVARSAIWGKGVSGAMGVLADREREVLVGAWAVGPQAGEWIHQAVLAVKLATPVSVLRDTVAQFPTFSEIYLNAVEALDL